MPLVTKLGIYELTIAVLSGWAMVATLESPEALKRAGVRHLGRIRQGHLDLLFQGTILTVIGLAMNPIPTWIGILLVLGAFAAPLLLFILAFDSELQRSSTVYRAINMVVLVGFSVGWVGLAVTLASR
jgi:hypothetical protein